jgi:TPR repeat protein
MKSIIATIGICLPLLVNATNNEAALLRVAADQDDSEAQRKMMALFVDGKARNMMTMEEAAAYLRKSIEQGNMTAFADFALYSIYTVNPEDNSELETAIAMLRHSADNGNAVGQMRRAVSTASDSACLATPSWRNIG